MPFYGQPQIHLGWHDRGQENSSNRIFSDSPNDFFFLYRLENDFLFRNLPTTVKIFMAIHVIKLLRIVITAQVMMKIDFIGPSSSADKTIKYKSCRIEKIWGGLTDLKLFQVLWTDCCFYWPRPIIELAAIKKELIDISPYK